MKIVRSKSKASTVALVSVLAIAATFVTYLPTAAAQKTEAIAYLSFRPNPIGVNQELLINAWVAPPPPMNWSIFYSIPRTGYMFYFTDPDGNIDIVGPLNSTREGATWFTYTPDQVGDWTVRFSWAGDADFTACETEEQPLIVQQDPIPSWPAAPLPTDEPWGYPINPDNREWYQISGLWGRSSYNASETGYNPYSQAPSSSHILWKLPPPEGLGGLIGGDFGTAGQYAVSAISIDAVMAGRGYYQSGGMIHCLDIRTGEELWTTPGSFTQAVIDACWPLYHEGEVVGYANVPTLLSIDSRLIKYDGLTGEILLNETGITGFHLVDYPYIYTYTFDGQLIKWSVFGSTTDFSQRVVWNVTAPWIFEYNIQKDIIVSIVAGYGFGISGAINATTGAELWILGDLDLPFIYENINPTLAYGKVFYPTIHRRYAAVNLTTGEVAWLSEEAEYPWGDFWAYGTAAAYGMVYGGGYAGVYAFNQSNGSIVWHYSAGDSGYETPFGTWAFFSTPVVADGKVYAATGEHTPPYPTYRGEKLHCINAWNGDPIWSIMGYWTATAAAEGALFANNAYDGGSYCFGKGSTATTVSVSPKTVANGSSVLIEGTVMDQSPAQPGTPAVSKESMSEWMEYLHMQQPKPSDVTGVPVQLYATDSGGNAIDLGEVTTDCNGYFSCLWTPPNEGSYAILAKFNGDESYYSSFAQTGIGVEAAPPAPPEEEPAEPAPDYTPLFLGIIATVAVLIGVSIVNLWALRKRT